MKIDGCKVVDAKKRLTVTVTKLDAMKGRRGDPLKCAAAVALLRENKDFKAAKVQISKTYVKKGNVWLRYRTPSRLKLEMVSFDRGAPPHHSEGVFDLIPPTESDKLGQQKYYSPSSLKQRQKNKKLRVVHRRVDGVRPGMR